MGARLAAGARILETALRPLVPAETREGAAVDWRLISGVALLALASRLIIVVSIVVGAAMRELTEIRPLPLLAAGNLRRVLDSVVTYGDFAWYASTVQQGYFAGAFDRTVQTNLAFFPLQGWLIAAITDPVARLAFSGAMFALGLAFFVGFALRFVDRATTLFAVALICFWPGSFALTQFRAESVMFACLAAALYFACRRQLLPLLLACLLAGFAKPNGILIFVAAAPFLLSTPEGGVRLDAPALMRLALLGLACVAGPVAMSVLCWIHVGEPLAWAQNQTAWGASFDRPLEQLDQLFSAPMLVGRWGWDLELFNTFAAALCLVAIVMLARTRHWALAVYLFLYAAMTYVNFGTWIFMRHLSTALPMFLALGMVRAPVAQHVLLAILVAVAALTVALGGAGYIPAWS